MQSFAFVLNHRFCLIAPLIGQLFFYLVTLSQNTYRVFFDELEELVKWLCLKQFYTFQSGMESDESIDLVDSEAVNAYGSVVAKKEHENLCEHFEGENIDPPRFHSFINFFKLKFSILIGPRVSWSFLPVERSLCSLENILP